MQQTESKDKTEKRALRIMMLVQEEELTTIRP
jgi:hypothetical protein